MHSQSFEQQQLRLEYLQIASRTMHTGSTEEIAIAAQKFYDFLTGDAPQQEPSRKAA